MKQALLSYKLKFDEILFFVFCVIASNVMSL